MASRRGKIRLVTVAGGDVDATVLTNELKEMLDDVRIPAEVEVVPARPHDELLANLAGASIVFVPMRVRTDEILDPESHDLLDTMGRLPLAAAVAAAAPVDLAAGPETETATAIAAAEERLDTAEARKRRLESELQRADNLVARLRAQAAIQASDEVEAELEAAEVRLATVQRRTLKARAVVELAREELAERIENGA